MREDELKATLGKNVKIVNKLKNELVENRKKEKDLENQIKELKSRRRAIYCIYSNSGELQIAEALVKRTKLNLDDLKLPVVVWSTPRWFHTEGVTVWVVSKVTAKRIYVRRIGSTNETYYNKITGDTPYSGDGVIDIQSTFPTGFKELQCTS